MRALILFAIVYACWISKTNSQACLYLCYDGFQYDPGTSLNGLSGGSGWSAPWDVQSGNTSIPGYQSLDNSLEYLDLQTAGGKGSGGRDYLTSGRLLQANDSGPFVDYVAPGQIGIGTLRGDTLWHSVLLSKMNDNDQSVFTILHNGSIPWYHHFTGSLSVGVGYFGTNSNVNGERRWSLQLEGGYYQTNVIASATAFFVLRIIFGESNTTIDLFLNPEQIGADGDPGSPDLSVQTASLLHFRSYSVYLGDSPGNGQVDEIRFAGSLPCVAPDPVVEVNLPPVAAFHMTPGQGTSPLLVQFDGSASFDPEGGNLNYLWNFGDGSAGSGSMNPVHIYQVTGEIPVSLTVTDPEGLSHTIFQTLILLNEYETYSCQTSITCLNMPSCGQNDGRVRIHAGNHFVQLVNPSNIVLTPEEGNDYHGLSPGKYQLFVSGNQSACTDTFTVFMHTDSTTCENWIPHVCSMESGTNMSSFSDWNFERPMKNLFKHIRSDILTFSNSQSCWDCGVLDEMEIDVNGYPLYIPQNTSIGSTMVRYVISTTGGNLRQDSVYILLYEGQGTITINGGVSIQSGQPGRISFSPLNNGNIWIHITMSASGDHIRNIRLVRPQHEFTDLEADPFYETFTAKIIPFSVLRFMDWGRTNNSELSSWENRAATNYFTYATDAGVPYEIMIQLANMTGKDVWVCIPHLADDHFITQLATLFRDQLNSGSKIYLEYSNEVWNWIFSQAHHNNNNRPLNLNYGRAMAEKAGRVFRIWHEVFAGQECRVKRVLGLQGGYNSLNEQIMSWLKQSEWDYGSPTHYFGLEHGSAGNPVLNSESTVSDVMDNAANSWEVFKPLVKRDYDNVKVLGKEVITYEGGQHFVGNVFGIPYEYQQAMWDAQYSPEMYGMYREIYQTIRSLGCRLAVNFSLASPQESVYGSWGVLNDIDLESPFISSAPKYQALIDEMPPETCRQTFYWTGARSSLWSDVCNWDKSVLPGTESTVIIQAGSAHQPEVNIDVHIKALTVLLQAGLTVLTGISFLAGNP